MAAPANVFQFPPEQPGSDSSFSLLAHLDELRKRLVRSCIAVGIGMVVAFSFIERLVNFVLAPSRRMLPPGSHLIFTQPGEAFSFYVQVALLAGAVAASPFVLYQFWRMLAPALYAGQKKFAIPFVGLTTAGAVGGAAFSHYIVFPYMIAFFGTFSSSDTAFLPRLEPMFDLYIKMLLGMVAVFQIPTVVLFMARMRLLTARFLWKNTRYAILIIFIVSAVVTPSSDPWNQAIFAAPMIVLYLFSIGIAWAVRPAKSEGAQVPSWWFDV